MEEIENITYESACLVTGDNPDDIKIYDALPEKRRITKKAQHRMEIITEAIWIIRKKKPDFINSQIKYRPWGWIEQSDTNGSGFVFSAADYDYSDAAARSSAPALFSQHRKMQCL